MQWTQAPRTPSERSSEMVSFGGTVAHGSFRRSMEPNMRCRRYPLLTLRAWSRARTAMSWSRARTASLGSPPASAIAASMSSSLMVRSFCLVVRLIWNRLSHVVLLVFVLVMF